MGIFIKVELDESKITPELAQQLVDACPVNIFALEGAERVYAQPEQEDECTLCELCLKLSPRGAVAVRKLYKNETLYSGNGTK